MLASKHFISGSNINFKFAISLSICTEIPNVLVTLVNFVIQANIQYLSADVIHTIFYGIPIRTKICFRFSIYSTVVQTRFRNNAIWIRRKYCASPTTCIYFIGDYKSVPRTVAPITRECSAYTTNVILFRHRCQFISNRSCDECDIAGGAGNAADGRSSCTEPIEYCFHLQSHEVWNLILRLGEWRCRWAPSKRWHIF